MAGATRASRSSPASVSATLRVVRFIRRTPRRSSMLRSRWLRLETETRLSSAARRKLRVRATATKASRSRRSKFFIVRYSEQAVWNCLSYCCNRKGAYHSSSFTAFPPYLEESCHGKTYTWFHRPRRLRHRPRRHGHVRLLRPRRPQREHRDHPCRARCRHYAARHRRLLRHGPQRDADPRGADRTQPRQCADQRQVRRAAHARQEMARL